MLNDIRYPFAVLESGVPGQLQQPGATLQARLRSLEALEDSLFPWLSGS